jgi:hypothetical protein
LSRRNHITHTLSITVKPDSFNPTLTTGDLVRVRLERTPSTGASSLHNYLYEVDRIGKNLSGDVLLDLTEFPVDDQLRSVVALEVDSAIGNGVLMPTGITGITCDINSLIDTSVPAEVGSNVPGFDGAYDFNFGGFNSSGLGDFGTGNAGDGIGGQGAGGGGGAGSGAPSLTSDGGINNPAVGDTLTAPSICEGGDVTFYRIDPSVPGGKVIAAQATSTYTLVINDVDKSVYSETRCPDPTSPTGYGDPISSAPTRTISNGTFPAGTYRILGQRLFSATDTTNCSGTLITPGTDGFIPITGGGVLDATFTGPFTIQYFTNIVIKVFDCSGVNSPNPSDQMGWVIRRSPTNEVISTGPFEGGGLNGTSGVIQTQTHTLTWSLYSQGSGGGLILIENFGPD